MQLTWQHISFSLDGCRATLRLGGAAQPPASLAGTMQVAANAVHFVAGEEPAGLAPGRCPAELTVYSARGVATGKGDVEYRGSGRFEVSASRPVELVQRRAHPRVPVQKPVELEPAAAADAAAPGAGSGAVRDPVLLDLSVGGGCLETTLPLAAGHEVRLRIPAPPAPLRLTGRVLWTAADPLGNRRSAGLQWTGMLQAQRDELRQLLAATSRR